jgi:hypothetical protein
MAYICSMKITATAPRICLRGALAVAAALFTFLARVHPVLAQNAPSPSTKQSTTASSTSTTGAQSRTTTTVPQSTNPIVEYFLDWFPRVTRIQSEQPHWVTPLVTVTPRLEEEVRYDQFFQSLPHGKTTDNYGGGKGLELIPFQNTELILGFPAWISHGGTKVHGTKKKIAPSDGWADETFLIKYRLLSANEEKGNYILTAFMGFSAPTGDAANSNGHAIFTPTIAGGKGWAISMCRALWAFHFPWAAKIAWGCPWFPIRRSSTASTATSGPNSRSITPGGPTASEPASTRSF